MLLVAAFTWLFIGSLIIFHEEHVLGKHFNFSSQLFISPKSKDKQVVGVKLIQPVQKLYENGSSSAILAHGVYSALFRIASDIKSRESSTFHADDILQGNLSLRAPPTV